MSVSEQRRADIFAASTNFRRAIERTPKAALPITFECFPRGACGDATLLLGKRLAELELGVFHYVLGTRKGWSHAWLEGDGFIVDITADQFPDMLATVIVSRCSDWHLAFKGNREHIADFDIFDRNTRAVLGAAYAAVLANLDA